MAKNYEAVRDTLRAAGEDGLEKLEMLSQEHRNWLQCAANELRAQVEACRPKEAQRAKKTRSANKVRGIWLYMIVDCL